MQTKFLIILFVFSVLSPMSLHSVYGPCIDNPDWPYAPCYPPTDITLRTLREDWSEYYDYKGKEWMETKKLEMQAAIQNGTLEKWMSQGPPLAHTNIHFYYYVNGEVPAIDGSYIYDNYGPQDWLTLPIPGFSDSIPPTGDRTFKIKYSDVVQSITILSDEPLGFWGFDLKLKQKSYPVFDIKIPKNFPTPASYTGVWNYGNRPVVLADGTQMDYEILEEPCYFHYRIFLEDNRTNVEISYSVIATGTWKLYSPIEFYENDACYNEVFYTQTLESGSLSSDNDPYYDDELLRLASEKKFMAEESMGGGSGMGFFDASTFWQSTVIIPIIIGVGFAIGITYFFKKRSKKSIIT